MFFTDDPNIESLLGWWRSNQSYRLYSRQDLQPDYLCLIVSGGLKFDNLFNKLLDKIHAFDLVTGKNLGVFL